jgi:membrane associated rhomboid family serine protease
LTDADDAPKGPWGSRDPAAPVAPELAVVEPARPPWPWTVLLLIGVCVAVWLAQVLVAPWLGAGALSMTALREGRFWTLLTHIGLHAGLPHLAFNMLALAQLGREIAPLFGTRLRGNLVFLGLFVACGLAGGVAFVLINPTGVAVGASGAICGIWGAGARLSGKGTLRDAVTGPAARGFVMMNLILIALGLVMSGLKSVGIAWEAHLGGYLAGVFLIGPALRLAHRRLVPAGEL